MLSDTTRGSGTYMRGNPTLTGAARLWPTATAADCTGHAQTTDDKTEGQTGGATLAGLALGRQGRTMPKAGKLISERAVLNPRFVEALMGFPRDWTAFDASETPSSRRKRHSRFERSSKGR